MRVERKAGLATHFFERCLFLQGFLLHLGSELSVLIEDILVNISPLDPVDLIASLLEQIFQKQPKLLLAPAIAARFKVEQERPVGGLCRQLRPPSRPGKLEDFRHILSEVEASTILIDERVQRLPEDAKHWPSKVATLDPARHSCTFVTLFKVAQELRGQEADLVKKVNGVVSSE